MNGFSFTARAVGALWLLALSGVLGVDVLGLVVWTTGQKFCLAGGGLIVAGLMIRDLAEDW